MDEWGLQFFNQTLAHPLLDGVMIGLSTAGLAVLPLVGLVWLLNRRQRRGGWGLLLAVLASLGAALLFQYLADRPRPETVRLVLTSPNFPAFPSGHAAIVFAAAVFIAFYTRRPSRWLPALTLAALIATSRVYLGHHYPTDVLAGGVLGGSLGAASYGLVGCRPVRWQWLLWPQVALAVVISQMAYLDLLPFHLLRWPLADKVLHFLLVGAVTFWLNLWLGGRMVRLWRWKLPVAVVLPLTLALLEEGAQAFSPLRTADVTDLASDTAGMLFFWWLSVRLLGETQKLNGPAVTWRLAGGDEEQPAG